MGEHMDEMQAELDGIVLVKSEVIQADEKRLAAAIDWVKKDNGARNRVIAKKQ